MRRYTVHVSLCDWRDMLHLSLSVTWLCARTSQATYSKVLMLKSYQIKSKYWPTSINLWFSVISDPNDAELQKWLRMKFEYQPGSQVTLAQVMTYVQEMCRQKHIRNVFNDTQAVHILSLFGPDVKLNRLGTSNEYPLSSYFPMIRCIILWIWSCHSSNLAPFYRSNTSKFCCGPLELIIPSFCMTGKLF